MLTVTNYHYIRNDFTTPYPSIFGMTPEAFRLQLIALGKIGKYIHPQELASSPNTYLKSKEHFLLVTFDDGLKEQYELAKPILEELGIPALFFVNSINFIEQKVSQVHKIHILRSKVNAEEFLKEVEKKCRKDAVAMNEVDIAKARLHYNYDTPASAQLKYILNFKLSFEDQTNFINSLFNQTENESDIVRKLYMNENQLQKLASLGMLGSHTHSHLPLGLLNEDVIRFEIKRTKDYLETLTETTIASVSYPYGSAEACAHPVGFISAQEGHKLGFTMERGINYGEVDPLRLKRFDCNDLPLGKNSKAFEDAYRSIY